MVGRDLDALLGLEGHEIFDDGRRLQQVGDLLVVNLEVRGVHLLKKEVNKLKKRSLKLHPKTYKKWRRAQAGHPDRSSRRFIFHSTLNPFVPSGLRLMK